MKRKYKAIVLLLAIAIIIPVLAAIYFYASYINDTITVGTKYGFTIGDTKTKTYEKAKVFFKDNVIFILHPIDDRNYGPHIKYSFTNKEYALISNRDVWEFYYSESYFNSLKLTFKDNKLVQIYRHRKKLELP